MARFKQGFFRPRNVSKYVGNPETIVYRSSWELFMCQFLDNNPNVLRWSSEEFYIPYIKPTDGKVHRYFPDYWVESKDRTGNIRQQVIEVKPNDQVHPEQKKRLTEYDKVTYNINMAKWQAATEFCRKRGIEFHVLTEREMFRQ